MEGLAFTKNVIDQRFKIEILNPDLELGRIKFALIDFDGTISVIRQGWENVMIPLMIEMICGGKRPTPDIVREVQEYVDYSTGILTIKQMEWLAKTVRRYGMAKPLDPYVYKRIYNERLMRIVNERLKKLRSGELRPDDLMIEGSRMFLKGLFERKVIMFLVSGTDHQYVLNEAEALQITQYFRGGVYGALDRSDAHTKEKIIRSILQREGLKGNELLVVGDGPVEIRNAKERGAIALGVASDEVRRRGLNKRKRERLIKAGADIIIPDYLEHDRILKFLFNEDS